MTKHHSGQKSFSRSSEVARSVWVLLRVRIQCTWIPKSFEQRPAPKVTRHMDNRLRPMLVDVKCCTFVVIKDAQHKGGFCENQLMKHIREETRESW